MELIYSIYGAITVTLLVLHFDDYMKSWPTRRPGVGQGAPRP
jgi:hypothetical protein